MATMESLIGLVNRIQRACTVLGDYGGEGMPLWEALPSVAVVGGQFWKIFSLRKRCWQRFPSSWIWYPASLPT